jgi:hypothetical protein
MAERCKAFFGGLEVQVSFSMTRSHGTSPDVGQLVFRRGGTLPSNYVGDLVLTNGSTEIVTFHDCMLRNPSERIGGTRDIVYQIMDRRWKWKTPTLFGQYNVRDEANVLIEGHQKSARQLALLALEALHYPDVGSFDVSALPTDPELAPHVVWHYEPAAVFLDKLCSLFGCTVNLMNDNSVRIITENTGDEPSNTGLMYPVESGLIINPAPDYVSAYAGDTWFDGWLTTEDIGAELNGAIKPIEMLSYTPDSGWKSGDPGHGYDAQIRGKLRSSLSNEMIDKTIELANRNLFRMRRITGFPPGQLFFPGFTLEGSVGSASSLPTIGDASKVYLINDSRTAIWTGSGYIGVTYRASLLFWALIDPLLLPNLDAEPMIAAGTREEMEAERVTLDNPRYILVAPEVIAIDARLLLPLLGTRIETGFDEHGKRSRKIAEVAGVFHETDFKLRNKTTTKISVWKHGIRVDAAKGHVILGAPAYKRGASGVEQAQMLLRCGYGFRPTPYGSRYHRQFNLASGNTLNIANATVNRTDVNEYRVQNYGSDYNDLSVIDATITNTEAIDTILNQAATEHLKQYQNYVAPKRKQYTPFRSIDTNGKVLQVSYQGGHGQLGEMTVSIGGSFDLGQPPAKKKQMMELQQRSAEFALQNFRVQQMDIGNVNASSIKDIA